ncbi:Hypothetical protein PBC10988_29290 [Planctomycetales bacterium 10988]|nr:Hypothetical protein PBC10988_29290 [Planctomycetales bacterium 10988]
MIPLSEMDTKSQESKATQLDPLIAEIDAAWSKDRTPDNSLASSPSLRSRLTGSQARYLEFELEKTRFAISLEHVLHVDRVPEVTPLPFVPDWIWGIVNLRGELTSVVDLRQLFGFDSQQLDRETRLMVIHDERADISAGLLVDRVWGIRNLANEQIDRTIQVEDQSFGAFVTGVIEEDSALIALFDAPEFLQSEQMSQFSALAEIQ